jgi:hypothetical protein
VPIHLGTQRPDKADNDWRNNHQPYHCQDNRRFGFHLHSCSVDWGFGVGVVAGGGGLNDLGSHGPGVAVAVGLDWGGETGVGD